MLEEMEDGTVLHVIVVPNAKKNEIVGVDEARRRLKVKIRAPPVEGRANKELVSFLSKLFGARVEILRGEKSREKDVFVAGKSVDEVRALLHL